MGFENFADFIDMGGHGLYVWLSYAIALGVDGYKSYGAAAYQKTDS